MIMRSPFINISKPNIFHYLFLCIPFFFTNLSHATVKINEAFTKKKENILVIGDSLSAAYNMKLSEGWVSLLDKQVQKHFNDYRVINAAVSGDTTDNALQGIQQHLVKYQPRIVLIEIGGNDGLRGHPLSIIKKNLAAIIEACLKLTDDVVLMEIRIPPNYGPLYTKQFSQIYQTLSQVYQVTLIPFALNEIAIHSHLMQRDGIHPTAQAQPKIVDLVWPHFKPVIEKTKSRSLLNRDHKGHIN